MFNEDLKTLQKTIDCFLSISFSKRLYLIDNTKTSDYKGLFHNEDIIYIENKKNVGFGSGHNKVLDKVKDESLFHLILNPDVFFSSNIIIDLTETLTKEEQLIMIAPKVVFPNGDNQYNIRKYPSAFDLIIRKLHIFKGRIHKQEYRDRDLSKPFYPEAIHGCFMLFKTEDFVSLGGFDERYFLYMEDIDICRKIDAIGKKKLYYPNVTVTHVLKQGSSKSFKLLLYHLSSAIKYFFKWRRYN